MKSALRSKRTLRGNTLYLMKLVLGALVLFSFVEHSMLAANAWQGMGSLETPQSIGPPERPFRPWQAPEVGKKKRKWVAISCAIMAGPFGAHRLYLGTDVKVPVIYTATLGGGLGLLPLVDVVLIAVTRDITRFENNSNIFIWSEDATPR